MVPVVMPAVTCDAMRMTGQHAAALRASRGLIRAYAAGDAQGHHQIARRHGGRAARPAGATAAAFWRPDAGGRRQPASPGAPAATARSRRACGFHHLAPA